MKVTPAPAQTGAAAVLQPSAPAASGADEGGADEGGAAREAAALRKLQARAAWFSLLVYEHHEGLGPLLEEAGVEHFECIADPSASTAAFAFVHEGRAWLVFRGSNDWNDWASNVSYLPAWHFGFRWCFASIAAGLDRWVEARGGGELTYCITGHSLGGALATLAAWHVARAGRPVEMLCTFGAPRVLNPWQVDAFDKAPANLPDGRRLGDVTTRFVDKYELVAHVPLWVELFQHVGRHEECGPPPAPASERDDRLSDLAEAWEEAMKAPIVGPYMLSVLVAATALFRAWKAPKAHKTLLYAKNIDPTEAGRVVRAPPTARPSGGRLRWWAPLLLAVFGLPRLALAVSIVFLLGRWVVRLFAEAPLDTLLIAVGLAAAVFVGRYVELRNQRRTPAAPPPGKQDHILRS